VDFTYRFAARGAPAQGTFIDPFLDSDVRPGFELEVALAGIPAVITHEGALDVDRMCVMALDEIAVIAVHRPDQRGQRGDKASGE